MKRRFKATMALAVVATMLSTNLVYAADAGHVNEGDPHVDPTVAHYECYQGEPTVVQEGTDCMHPTILRYQCQEDEKQFHEDIIEIDHDWEDQSIEPTCTEPGLIKRVCKVCGTVEEETVEALGHAWSSESGEVEWGRVTKEPTCTSEGEAIDYCTRCGETNDKILPRVIEKLDHEFVTKTDAKATCVSKGKTHEECKNCGLVKEDSEKEIDIDENAHDWDKWVTEKAATCAEEGVQVRWCKLCGDKEEKSIPKLEAKYVVVDTVLEDCYHEYDILHCVNCDGEVHEDKESERRDVVSHHFDHTEEYILEQVDATCEEDGYIDYKCIWYDDVDGHEDDEAAVERVILPANGHKWGNWMVRHEKGEQGNEYGYWIRKCSVCGKVEERVSEYAPEEICEALGHKFEETDRTEPTCTEAGSVTSKCFRCGKEEVEEIPALGHKYETEEVAATCTEAAKTVYTCSVCGDSYAEENGEPAGHQFVTEVVIPATCEEDGKNLVTCSVCGDIHTETVEATGHSIVTDEAVAPTTTSTGKTEGSHCELCGKVIVAQEEIPMLKDGLTKDEDDVWRLYKEGEFQEDFTGIADYDGGKFFVTNGVKSDANGLNLFEKTWYFLSQGQVQDQYDGFAEYNNNWFIIEDGILDENANGLFDYDGGTFLFAAGRLRTDVSGLWQDFDGTWYYLADGQVVDYEGVVEYNGAFFYVQDGKLASDYNGTIEYDGAKFNVVAGQLYAA